MFNRVSVTQESDTGRNERFRDNLTGETMTRAKFVREINRGTYDDYYVSAASLIVIKRTI